MYNIKLLIATEIIKQIICLLRTKNNNRLFILLVLSFRWFE